MAEDRVFQGFLKVQEAEGLALAAASDLLELEPFGGSPANRYLARFSCRGLVRFAAGEVEEAERFEVGIFFPRSYLRRADPSLVVTWLGPPNVFHPNISAAAPVVCVGRLAPGTPLVDILYQLFEMITYRRVTMREDDALNKDACVWARNNQHRFPVDDRPLKRRRVPFHAQMIPAHGSHRPPAGAASGGKCGPQGVAP